jgi:hypothetical protein
MKNRIGRKLLTATLFVVSMTSIAGCYYDRGYDRDYAYRDRYRDGYYWRREDLENRHAIRDYPFGDRDFGHD